MAELTREQIKAHRKKQLEDELEANRKEKERIKQHQIKMTVDNITLAYNTIYNNLIILDCCNNSEYSAIEKSHADIINKLIEQYSFIDNKLLNKRI